jgi:hypothetical protein
VVLVPGLALGSRFYRGPERSVREQLAPGWPYEQGLVATLDLVGAEGNDRGVILAEPGEAVEAILSPALRSELALLRDWVVESSSESVLVFQHEKVVPPEEVSRFLEALRRIVGGLAESRRPAPEKDDPQQSSIRPDLRGCTSPNPG